MALNLVTGPRQAGAPAYLRSVQRSFAETGPVSTFSPEARDFYRWSQQGEASRRLAAMRANRAVPLDLENLAEEIESLGSSQLREMAQRYRAPLVHRSKGRCRPLGRSNSRHRTIATHRAELADLLAPNPSLRRRRQSKRGRVYPSARELAALETGRSLASFPKACPFTLEQVEDPEWLA